MKQVPQVMTLSELAVHLDFGATVLLQVITGIIRLYSGPSLRSKPQPVYINDQ